MYLFCVQSCVLHHHICRGNLDQGFGHWTVKTLRAGDVSLRVFIKFPPRKYHLAYYVFMKWYFLNRNAEWSQHAEITIAGLLAADHIFNQQMLSEIAKRSPWYQTNRKEVAFHNNRKGEGNAGDCEQSRRFESHRYERYPWRCDHGRTTNRRWKMILFLSVSFNQDVGSRFYIIFPPLNFYIIFITSRFKLSVF